ncbi:hydantoinase/oxoprolinase family protein [Gemmobacter sp.]|uniref:hydantoinase/oxoprolinase family protein n=1 Tax=Gemmobacter sp. TaxID=1898957 RepID=UPI002AFF3513|nr:hydantoinase/oxoprolinase family protein [Gemmobacter sp.]
MSYRIGIDVGGTFTDVVAIAADGRTMVAKAPTTTDDQSRGVLDGLSDLAGRLGLDLPCLLAQCSQIVHGTTVATNALLERKGARVGLLTTDGHRDVLEMHEGLKPDRYNLRMAPPEPLVPRNLRLGVPERIAHDGAVLAPLDEAAVIDTLHQLRAAQVQAVAVAYLHAYRNPAHERRTAELVAEHLPGVYCSISSEVLPQIKEYERFSTTVVNAYVGPALRSYLTRLDDGLKAAGFAGDLFVILSHGGIVRIPEAIRLGAATVLSGPAGGIVGARMAARMMGLDHVLPFDMGGTSTEISLVVDGTTALSAERGVGGTRVALRAFDILSIGAGGGSLAQIDAAGRFDVGPQSAGAWPGPICYARGGTQPTVTDANLILGYLNPDGFRGGRARLDVAATETAMAALGQGLGTDTIGAADGIFRLINVKMADGFRLMTIRRGVDPRRFALMGFGGAAGIHATAIARELGVPRVIVPEMASVLSAWGMLASDLRYELVRSDLAETSTMTDAGLRARFAALHAEALERCGFHAEPGRPLGSEYSAEMRYGDQIFEIDVSLDGLALDAQGLVAAVEARFHARHEELFTYASPGHPVEIVNLRVAVVASPISGSAGAAASLSSPAATPPHTRMAVIGGQRMKVAVHALAALRPGQVVAGPALIESENTTVLLHPTDRATVARPGWLDIAVGGSQLKDEV